VGSADYLQASGFAGLKVDCSQRPAIHRGVVVCGHIDRRIDVLRHHSPEAVAQAETRDAARVSAKAHAHALALARMVMGAGLPVRLKVLVPAVENAVGGDAMRPGDVLNTRRGLTVEVGNTDAEGRLILADALQRAAEFDPALTVDFATLTGAARAALGPELPPMFTDDETLAAELIAAAEAEHDPVWRMPLWQGYAAALDSEVADLANDPAGWAQAGAVTAALFLKRFAPETGAWVHFDVFAWNPRGRPGWPVGGEVFAVRAVFKVLSDRYGA
jgi:leucyl aminopeptidase